MVKRPRIPEPSPGPDNSTKDELDAAEGENLGSRDFPFLKEKSEFHREEKTRAILSLGMATLLTLSFLAICSMVFVMTWHYVVSSTYHWLSESQLSDMKSLLFSGAVAGAVAAFVQRHTS